MAGQEGPLQGASAMGEAACGEWGGGQSHAGASHDVGLAGKTVVPWAESAAMQRPPTWGPWRDESTHRAELGGREG